MGLYWESGKREGERQTANEGYGKLDNNRDRSATAR